MKSKSSKSFAKKLKKFILFLLKKQNQSVYAINLKKSLKQNKFSKACAISDYLHWTFRTS